MSNVILHPNISELNPESLCYSIYTQLYANFFNAQDKKDTNHPWGVQEGDDTSLRLRNTAYNFADAIAGAVNIGSEGSEGNIMLEFLKKSGGDMAGTFTANYGFEAGVENNRILETFSREVTNDQGRVITKSYGLRITGDLDVGSESLYIGGKQLLSYNQQTNTARLYNQHLSFGDSSVSLFGELVVGESSDNGIYISRSVLRVSGFDVYHHGSANLSSVDWSMKDAGVTGTLDVQGAASLYGKLKALAGVELGINNSTILSIELNHVNINSFLSFGTGFGIKIKGIPVLIATNNTDIQIGAAGGDLLLGSLNTNKTKLLSNITDVDGSYLLLSKYGAAYFPDSFKTSHNFGDILLSTYRVDSTDEGMIVHKKLRFGSPKGGYLYGVNEGIGFTSSIEHINGTSGERTVLTYDSAFNYQPSTSKYKVLNRYTDSLNLSTNADFVCFDKPVEARTHIGIDQSFTRLTDGALYFNSEKFLLSAADGIKHYGNAYFMDSLSSNKFSSGFAGAGWAILQNKTTGNTAATFDELTIRKKMRIYELEVQKITATNGSLWVSDNCSGDTVIKL